MYSCVFNNSKLLINHCKNTHCFSLYRKAGACTPYQTSRMSYLFPQHICASILCAFSYANEFEKVDFAAVIAFLLYHYSYQCSPCACPYAFLYQRAPKFHIRCLSSVHTQIINLAIDHLSSIPNALVKSAKHSTSETPSSTHPSSRKDKAVHSNSLTHCHQQ
jgi:hypothetical protein